MRTKKIGLIETAVAKVYAEIKSGEHLATDYITGRSQWTSELNRLNGINPTKFAQFLLTAHGINTTTSVRYLRKFRAKDRTAS